MQQFDLDMDSGLLHMTFSETMNASSINIGQIVLHSMSSEAGEEHALVWGSMLNSAVDSTVIAVKLSLADSNELKRLEIGRNSAWMTFVDTMILDQNMQNVIARVSGANALQVTVLTPDTTDPVLEAFDLNIDIGTLIMSFSETVRANTLSVAYITLRTTNSSSNVDEIHTLNASWSGSVSEDGAVIVIALGAGDLNEIKRLSALAISNLTTFITITSNTISDMAATPNAVTAINVGSGQRVQTYTPDTTEPTLTSFTLDLTTEILRLSFSETVNVSSVDVTRIVLQGSNASISNSVQ